MPQHSLPCLDAARASAKSYVQACVRARDSQYQFLAQAYLAYREGQRRPRHYAKRLQSILGRSPTVPEQKRPFLHLLHALLGQEDHTPRDTLPQFSKLTSALEEIDRAFNGYPTTCDEIVEYIKDCGGVGGLYDLSRIGSAAAGDVQTGQQNGRRLPGSVLALAPAEIPIPSIGANLTKVGRGYRLRFSGWEPGDYVVRLRVGPGGFLQGLQDLDDRDEEVA